MANAQILVVEDELIVARDVQNMLKSFGYAVPAIVSSGREAIQKTAETHPDLVLMDIKLKGDMDGVEAAEEIRARFDIPVVYLTAYADEETLQRAKITEPFGYVLKPFMVEELRNTIQMALYKHEMDKKLKESEARYRAISELTSDFAYSFHVEPDGTLVPEWMTEAFTRITGFTLDEVEARGDWMSLVHPDDRPVVRQRLQAVLSGQSDAKELGIVTKRGETRWLHVYSRPVWDEAQSRVVRIYGAAQDITERKRAEEAIKESEEKFRSIFESAYDFLIYLDTSGRILDVNKRALEAVGMSKEEIVGKRFTKLKIFPSKEILRVARAFAKSLIGGPKTLTMSIKGKEGKEIPLECSASFISKHGKIIGVMMIARDITERRRAEEALRESEEHLRRLVNNAPDIIFRWSVEKGLEYVSPIVSEITGYAPEELMADPMLGFEIATGKEPQIVADYEKAIAEGTAMPSREFPYVRKDGSEAYLDIKSVVVRDDEGNVIAFEGILHDVTERKRAEEKAQQRTAQLEALREVGLELTAQLNLDALLRSIVSRAIELLGGTGGGLYLYRPDRDVIEWAVAVGLHLAPTGTVLQQGEGLAGKVWESGEPLIVDDYQHWEGRAAVYEGYPWTSVVGVPVRWGEEFLGVLDIIADPTRTFSPADAELLGLFATQAAIAIRNAQLYEQAQRDARSKSVLLREVNHRVKNNMATIVGLLRAARYQAGIEDQSAYQSIIKDLINQVQGLATVHRLLSASEWAPLLLSELATQIIRSSLQMLPRDKRISADVAPSPVQVTPDQAHNLALAINELVTNTVKYALQERNAVHITVRIALEDDTVLFEFRNDGPGYPEEVLRLERHSVGFDLIQDLVHKGLDGELALHNDQGAVAIIRFPAQAQGE